MPSGTTGEYYDDDTEAGYVICKLCKAKLRNARLSNLKRHLRTMHQVDVGTQNDITTGTVKTKTKSQQKTSKETSTKIEISPNRLFRSYLGLVTEDNVPLTLLNSSNFRSLMDPLCKSIRKRTGKRIQLNSQSCQNALHLVADEVRMYIKKELRHKLISLKINTCDTDNTFVISAHLFREGGINSLILGLGKSNEGNRKLTEEIIVTLNRYDIDLNQLVGVTVNNETDVCMSTITTTFENITDAPLEGIHITRCGAHTALLCCQDVLNNEEICKYLQMCRNITNFVQKSESCQAAVDLSALNIPQKDCESRCGSTYTMVSVLQSAKAALKDCADEQNEDMEISVLFWDFVDGFIEAMGPLQRTILRYQEEELHYSDFYAQWLKCKLSTECIVQNNAADGNNFKYKIGTLVLSSMQQREISNECLHACLYLDPRFHRMLNPIQKTEAIRFLKSLWDKMCHMNPGDSVIGNDIKPMVKADTEDQLLDRFLSGSINHDPTVDSVTVYSKIDCLKLPFMKSDTDVLMFWEDKRHNEPELYQLSNICFAIPPTQISSKLVLSELKQIMASNRQCSKDTLESILLIKLNSSYLNENIVGTLPLFEMTPEDKSSAHNDPLSIYHGNFNSWPNSNGNSSEKFEDDENINSAFTDACNESNDELAIKEENGTNYSSKKPKRIPKNKMSTNIDNFNNDDVSQQSFKSYDESQNSTAANESSDDQAWKPSPGKENVRRKPRVTKRSGGQTIEIGESMVRKRRKRGKTKSEYLCVECGKKFTLLHSMKTHMMRHIGDKKYQCPKCPKSFVCSSGLYTHIKIHTSYKPHVCDICARSFRTAYELKQHNRYHSGEKNYQCEYCEQRFITAEKQRRHMRTHTGEKPYRCKYCDRAFAQSNDCNKHLKQHLGENIFQCELCPLRFPFVRDLRVHFASHKDEDEEIRARNLQAREAEEKRLQAQLGFV